MNPVPTIEGRVLAALQAERTWLATPALIARVYPEGSAPATAEQLIRKAVLRLRERGWVILSRPGRKSPGYLLSAAS